MTVLQRIKEKGYNPLKTKQIRTKRWIIVIEPNTKETITMFRFSKDGTRHIIIK